MALSPAYKTITRNRCVGAGLCPSRCHSEPVLTGHWCGNPQPLPLPSGEVAERSEDGEGRHVKKTRRCRHVKKICQWHIFSVDLGSYAAVASIRTYTALSWIPSQSPSVTALPKGEPRACTPLHSMKMERIGADTLHELFSTIRQLDGTPLSLIQTSAAYGRRFPVSWPAEPSDPQRSPAFSGGRAAAPPDGTAPSSACRCGQRTGRAPAKF